MPKKEIKQEIDEIHQLISQKKFIPEIDFCEKIELYSLTDIPNTIYLLFKKYNVINNDIRFRNRIYDGELYFHHQSITVSEKRQPLRSRIFYFDTETIQPSKWSMFKKMVGILQPKYIVTVFFLCGNYKTNL